MDERAPRGSGSVNRRGRWSVRRRSISVLDGVSGSDSPEDGRAAGGPLNKRSKSGDVDRGALRRSIARRRSQVFKSAPLFISSKGIGWKSRKSWFILTPLLGFLQK
ncbi:hypothetical protein NL676_031361 [Syzygium grande]|nr:hypothetical protein NL676_031361 [Syzygium grande]